jgi:hypothetical protein
MKTTTVAVLRSAVAAMAAVSLALALVNPSVASAQSASPTAAQSSQPGQEAQKGTSLLTIVLRHDQSKTLEEINEHLRQTGYYGKFPPVGIEVVSWYVMMGIGQVVTLRVPAERLREVNRAIEESAWGGYRTEFYPTYDYKPIAEAERKSVH